MGPIQEMVNSMLGAAAVAAVGSKIALEYQRKTQEAQQAAAASLAAARAEKQAVNGAAKRGVE